MNVAPITLSGRNVRLEPLSLDHLSGLAAVGLDPELWRWMPEPMRSPADMRAFVQAALAEQAAGTALPFATIEQAGGRVVGCTRFLNIERRHRRVEIGYTWVARAWQRTAVNTEAKLLMLTHAFETLGCIRVEFKTDSLNLASRAAILRLGAKEEGTLRNHMICAGGRIRHSVYYGIASEDWRAVKAGLMARLRQS